MHSEAHFNRRQAILALAASGMWLGCQLQTGRSLGSSSKADQAAMVQAVQSGDLAGVQRWLRKDPTLAMACDMRGRSCLVLASLREEPAIVVALRGSGFKLDIVEAVLVEDWERFESLATASPELANALHPIGGTPLHAAALLGQSELYRLRAAGCIPNANPPGGMGFTPARAAFENSNPVATRIALTELLSNGSDVNSPQRNGDSVLHAAVRSRDLELLKLAIRKHGDQGALDRNNRTPLGIAESLGWKEGVSILTEGAENILDNRNSRWARDANFEPIEIPDLSHAPIALQSEVTSNSHFNLKRVKELISKDPRLVFSLSTDDELPIEACAHVGNRPIIRYHMDQGAPFSLPTAVSLGDLEAVKRHLANDGASSLDTRLNDRGAHDFPVFWFVPIGGDDVAMAELLYSKGASLDQESMGKTALHWCVQRKRLELTHWFIEHGANLSPIICDKSGKGKTPLQLAIENQSEEFVKLLRGAGARS